MDYISDILDEIALEGLDGISIDGLWLRLLERPRFVFKENFDEETKDFLWNHIRCFRDVEFYQLVESRKPLASFNHYTVDPELGIIIETNPAPEEIYPHNLINDTTNNILGSCSTYETRKNVTSVVRKLTLNIVHCTYGNYLVIVANQDTRKKALIGSNSNPNLELSPLQYCILERIGRARYHGESTQGKCGLQVLGEDAKTIFYLRKFLLKHNLITKQPFQQKTLGNNLSGLLLHLPRFYKLIKPKFVSLTENVIKFLKDQPNCIADYNLLRDHLVIPGVLRKLTKVADFQRYVRTDIKVPYRTLYPDADVKQWKHKASDKEKKIRIVQLRDPNVDVRDVQKRLLGSYDDDEDDDDKLGLLNEKNRIIDLPLLTQCCLFLKKSGPDGLTQTEIAREFGFNRVQARTTCKNLVKTGAVGTFMTDVGRQRLSKFYLKCNDDGNNSMQHCIEENISEFLNTLDDCKTDILIENSQQPSCSNSSSNNNPPVITNNVPNNYINQSCSEQDSDSNIENIHNSEVVTLNNDIEIDDNTITSINSEVNIENIEFNHSQIDNDINKNTNGIENNNNKTSGKRAKDNSFELPSEKRYKLDKENNKSAVIVLTNKEESSNIENMETNDIVNQNITAISSDDRNNANVVVNENTNISDLSTNDQNSNESNLATDKISVDVEISEDFDWLLPGQSKKELDKLKEGQVACKTMKTYRLLKRSNLILEAVHEYKVINDIRKFVIIINEAEYREGQASKMDKKSLLRILFKLALDKHIKVYRVTLKSGCNQKTVDFICDTKVEADHPLIRSSVEFAKLKLHCPSNTNSSTNNNNKIKRLSIQKLKNLSHFPKFNRMKVMHRFLFYLVYNYEGIENQDQELAKYEINKECEITEDVTNLMPDIYYPKVDWRMFVAPLPKYTKDEENLGWCLMSDVLIRLPLSVFMQLIQVPYYVPELDSYLNHPIKRHLLVGNLPVKIRNCLTVARKYIFTIFEAMTRLVYIGLLQFGSHQNKEKEQVFTYVNKNASLLDTSLSKPGYNKISTDIDYPIEQYHFKTLMDVDEYWHNAWKICMNTRLGGRSHVMGTDVILENIQDKKEMIDAMKPREFCEASIFDLGDIPGDKLGAAGYDSALFAHLKRNWISKPGRNDNKNILEKKPLQIISTSQNIIKRKLSSSEQTKLNQNQRAVNSMLMKQKKNSSPSTSNHDKKNFSITHLNRQSRVRKRKPSIKIRHIKPTKKLLHRKPYYDQIDKEALKHMSKLRVDWSQEEDRVLLICKIASAFICPHTRKQINANMFVTFREILHRTFQSSKNKTSRACQRRVSYMLHSQNTRHNVNLCIEELRQDEYIMDKYGNTLEYIENEANSKGKKIKDMENIWKKRFIELVSYLMERYSNNFNNLPFSMNNVCENFSVPDNLNEFYETYNILQLEKSNYKHKETFKPVNNTTDIYSAIINCTIHSTLCCNSDKTSWSYHLFSIYQQYPERLLRSVLNKLRESQMVSFKKSYQTHHMYSNNYLPLSASPYQLSITYINLIQTKYQSDLYLDCYQTLCDLINNSGHHKTDDCDDNEDKGYKILSLSGGSTAMIIQLFCEDIVKFHIDIPDQIVVLDPNVRNKDETYARLVQRYQDILSNYKKDLTSSVLFQKNNYAYLNKADEDDDDDIYNDNDINNDDINNDDINDDDNDKKENRQLNEEGSDVTSLQNVVAKAASRIALYLMRDDLSNKATGMVPREMEHAHDFFVVNSCSVYVKINKCNLKQNGDFNEENDLFMNNEIIDDHRIKNILEMLRNSAVFHDNSALPTGSQDVDKNKVINEIINNIFTSDQIDLVKSIINKIESNKELGLTSNEIVNEFGNSVIIVDILNKLIDVSIILHTGVVYSRYVYYSFTRPWLIHSYRSIRMEKDARVPVKNSNFIKLSKKSDDTEDVSLESDVNHTSIKTDNQQPSTSKQINDTEDESKCNVENLNEHWNTQNENCKKLINHNMTHHIKVKIRPWIRIDGTLNRRVLDAMLSSVLGHIMLHPGISLSAIQLRFSPAYQPYNTRELCDLLIKLNCVNSYCVLSLNKPSLFSKPCPVTVNETTGLESEDNICYEPLKYAIINLGKFISTKPYSQDFMHCLLGR
ncbi:general transcription factor 3C polypeptide 1 [Lycorma delicatula]|uniref:general transcription factor 3C polypeptide 1 n=1 Tax=Lycorma delicatula TaxID=130591 RepID=UPI003F51526C